MMKISLKMYLLCIYHSHETSYLIVRKVLNHQNNLFKFTTFELKKKWAITLTMAIIMAITMANHIKLNLNYATKLFEQSS